MTDKTSGVSLDKEMKELVKVLPDLQANIRRFLAVRKYEAIKEEKKKVEIKERKERQKNRMSALSRPRAVVPTPPRAPRGKSTSNTSPAMQSRTKTLTTTKKKTLNTMEYYRKYGVINDDKAQTIPNKTEPTDIISGDKFDENITSLMKNINQITLTLNMHDSTLLPKTVDKVKKNRNNSLHGYFTFGPNSSSTTTDTDITGTLPTGIQSKSNLLNSNPPEKFLNDNSNPSSSPSAAGVGVGMYSEKVQQVLATLQAEYATLSKNNEKIKQTLSRSTTPTTATHITTHISNNNHLTTTATTSNSSSKHSSPNKQDPAGLNTISPPKNLGNIPGSMYSPSPTILMPSNSNNSGGSNSSSIGSSQYKQQQQQQQQKQQKQENQTESSGSSLVTVDSGAYIPIRRSGDPQLDSMVQDTLIRANNSILASSIPEHEEYASKDAVQSMLHNVVLQLNNTFMDLDETCRKDSHSSIDSIGLDALTRSITALQAQNNVTPSSSSTISTPYIHSQYNSTIPTTEPSQENSANNSHNNSMDSHTSNADSCDTNQTTVSELTIAIKDILANLSGGIFERAKLEFSAVDTDIRHSSPTHTALGHKLGKQGMISDGEQLDETRSVASAEGGLRESILSNVRGEMGAIQPRSNYLSTSSSQNQPHHHRAQEHSSERQYVQSQQEEEQEQSYPPLLMQSYLDSIYARNNTHTAIGNAQKRSQEQQSDEIFSYVQGTGSSLPEQEQERADLYALLQHQERSMQLIRESIQAIEQKNKEHHSTTSSTSSSYSTNHVSYNNTTTALPHSTASISSSYGPSSSLQQKLSKEKVSLLPLIGPGSGVASSLELDNYNYIKQFLPTSAGSKRSKSRGKKTKKTKSTTATVPNTEESELLTNLGNYLKRQKQAVSENKHLSYDELIRKAQTNMGVTATAVVAAAVVKDIKQQQQQQLKQQQQQSSKVQHDNTIPASYSNRDAPLRHTERTTEDDVDYSEYDAYRSQYKKHPPSDLYPIADNEGEGDEEDLIAAAVASESRLVKHSKSNTASQLALLQRRLILEREIEQYNASYNTHISAPEDTNLSPSKYSAYRVPEDTNLSPSKYSAYRVPEDTNLSPPRKRLSEETARPSSSAHKQHQPRNFNMSEALLQSPTLSSGEKTRSKQKISAHSPVKSPHSRHYAEEEVEPEGQASDGREWNSRFSVRDGQNGSKKETFRLKNEALRQSSEDLYETQRRNKHHQHKEQQEYRSAYMRPTPSTGKIEQHTQSAHSPTHSPKQPQQHRSSTSRSGSKKKLAGADIDEKFIENVEMLNVKAPTQLRATAQAAATSSPRRFIARLLHPFK